MEIYHCERCGRAMYERGLCPSCASGSVAPVPALAAGVPSASNPSTAASDSVTPVKALVSCAIFIAIVIYFASRLLGCGGGSWQTITSLSASDPQTDAGLISEPFTSAGKLKLVLDMPQGDTLDGVLGTIIPASAAGDPSSAILDGETVSLNKTLNTQEVSGLSGSYVLVVPMAGLKAWTIEIQAPQ